MRIVIVSPDGLSTILYAPPFVRALRAMPGIEVHTVSSCDDHGEEIARLGTVHHDIPMARFVDPGADIRYAVRLYRLFRRIRPDIAIGFTTKPSIYVPIAAKLAGIRTTVAACRGLGRAFDARLTMSDRVLHGVAMGLYRLGAQFTDVFWCTNPEDMAFFDGIRNPRRSRTVLTRNALNLADFDRDTLDEASLAALRRDLKIADGDRVAILVGRMIWQKGVREFAEAARRFRETRPHYKFLLVGPMEAGSPGAVPEEFIRTAEAESNLQWLGFRKDIAQLHAISDVSVLPSTYREGGYPRALIEPMALGKAVIAADTPHSRAPVEHGRNGFLVPVGDIDTLVARIDEVLSDDALRDGFGRRSFEKVREEFDDRMTTGQVLDALGLKIKDARQS